MQNMPPYLDVAPHKLGEGTPVRVRVIGDMNAIAQDFAEVMLQEIRDAQKRGKPATFIMPVETACGSRTLSSWMTSARS